MGKLVCFLKDPTHRLPHSSSPDSSSQGLLSLLVWGSQKTHIWTQYEDQRGTESAISKDLALSSGNQSSDKPGKGEETEQREA